MGRIASAVILGVIGVSGSWKAVWVGVAVVSLLSAGAIAMVPALSRVPALANPRRRR